MNKPIQYLITIEQVAPAPKGRTAAIECETQASLPSAQNSAIARQLSGPTDIVPRVWLNAILAFNPEQGSLPEADRVKILLSVYAGLRSCEIAHLRMTDVTDACGNIGNVIRVRGSKGGPARTVPIHSELRKAISAFRSALPGVEQFAVTRRDSTVEVQSVRSLTFWFHRLHKQADLVAHWTLNTADLRTRWEGLA